MDERFLFFSDSINDLPLLESVSKAFVCNGDEKILKLQKRENMKFNFLSYKRENSRLF